MLKRLKQPVYLIITIIALAFILSLSQEIKSAGHAGLYFITSLFYAMTILAWLIILVIFLLTVTVFFWGNVLLLLYTRQVYQNQAMVIPSFPVPQSGKRIIEAVNNNLNLLTDNQANYNKIYELVKQPLKNMGIFANPNGGKSTLINKLIELFIEELGVEFYLIDLACNPGYRIKPTTTKQNEVSLVINNFILEHERRLSKNEAGETIADNHAPAVLIIDEANDVLSSLNPDNKQKIFSMIRKSFHTNMFFWFIGHDFSAGETGINLQQRAWLDWIILGDFSRVFIKMLGAEFENKQDCLAKIKQYSRNNQRFATFLSGLNLEVHPLPDLSQYAAKQKQVISVKNGIFNENMAYNTTFLEYDTVENIDNEGKNMMMVWGKGELDMSDYISQYNSLAIKPTNLTDIITALGLVGEQKKRLAMAKFIKENA